MWRTLLLGLFLCSVGLGLGLRLNTAVRRRPPGFNSPPKLWWAKEITPDFHVAGRPTERQIKYAHEGGFKSIFSFYKYEDDDAGEFGFEYLPTTTEAEKLATWIGLEYKSLIGRKDDWWTVEVVQQFAEAIRDMPRPILLHCNRGYTIAFVTLMHMANLTRHDPGFEPKINSENFYRIVATMGLDFTEPHLKKVVSEITGEPLVANPPKTDAVPANWRDWWLAHPVAKNWFVAGGLRRSDVKMLKKTGFKAIVNLRTKINPYKGGVNPPLEEVTLLNIIDNTTTYGTPGKAAPRQNHFWLEKTRINPDLPNEYVGADSERNHERTNPDEFGDTIGYREDYEAAAFEYEQMTYYSMPISQTADLTVQMIDDMIDDLQEAGEEGPVLVHCKDVRRAAYIGVLAAAKQEDYSREWALRRLLELGFEASPRAAVDVFYIYSRYITDSDGTLADFIAETTRGDAPRKDEL